MGKVSPRIYRQQIGLLKKFLNGQMGAVSRGLVKEIKAAAKAEDFRTAGQLKRQYEALLTAQSSQKISGSFLESNPHVDRQLGRLVQILKPYGVNVSPERIECFDMATLQQKQTVGSMVVFSLGNPDKSQYRKFKVRYLPGGDPNNMAEIIRRRFRHQDWISPGLVVLDGGKAQLAIAGLAVPDDIPVIALAKREETIVLKSATGFVELKLPLDDPGLKLLRAIRDEAHRFATGFHTQLRAREFLA